MISAEWVRAIFAEARGRGRARLRWPLHARGRYASALEPSSYARARGMRFVYVGNVASELAGLSHTRCPECTSVLVERHDYRTVDRARLVEGACGARIPGIFD